MIISASRRTDIPSFFSEWFFNRLKEGYVYIRNPLFAHKVSKVPLNPDLVDCIVFWTKDPTPMLERLDELKDYMYYIQFTITGFGHDVEPNLADKNKVIIPAFQKLVDKIGPDRVIWRYDPILINEKYTMDYHVRAFEKIASALKGYTRKSVISLVDEYRFNKKALEALHEQEMRDQQILEFVGKLHDIAASNDMKIATCAEGIDLSSVGVEHNACIDKNLIEELLGGTIKVKKDPSQREECLCVESRDVGSFDTCIHGCKYCYATRMRNAVKDNFSKYDPDSPILCDSLHDDDKISEPKVKSLLDKQISLF
ncbi:MAG: DUF1848 domain-containing protein [Anaerovoracaceae bacterium]|nr:DUF1848 domain-containing protein [Bacillota bacterium]MDY2671104.1 DUF1848 domain-containing protein [Anaerovoracaceae bacterium]